MSKILGDKYITLAKTRANFLVDWLKKTCFQFGGTVPLAEFRDCLRLLQPLRL